MLDNYYRGGCLTLCAALLTVCFLAPRAADAQSEDESEDQPVPASLLIDRNGDGIVSIAAFGDSITRGVGDQFRPGQYVEDLAGHRPSGEAGYPLRIEQRMGLQVTNLGSPGEVTTENGVYRFATQIPGQPVDVVIIQEGSNDATFQVDPGAYYPAVQAMINIGRASGKQVILGTIPPTCCNHSGNNPWIDRYNNGLREMAVINDVPLADLNHAYNNTCNRSNCYLLNLPEGEHPNSAGYDISGETMMAALLQIPLFAPGGAAQLETALGLPPGTVQTKPDPVPAAPAARQAAAEEL